MSVFVSFFWQGKKNFRLRRHRKTMKISAPAASIRYILKITTGKFFQHKLWKFVQFLMLEKHNTSFIRETQKQCQRVFLIFCWFWCRFGYDYREERFAILETQRGNFSPIKSKGKISPGKILGENFPPFRGKNHCQSPKIEFLRSFGTFHAPP